MRGCIGYLRAGRDVSEVFVSLTAASRHRLIKSLDNAASTQADVNWIVFKDIKLLYMLYQLFT